MIVTTTRSVKPPYLVSIVVPVRNEIKNIPTLRSAVDAVFTSLGSDFEYEIVFTDNRSTDGTFDLIQTFAAVDPRIKAVRFSRNFGYQNSLLEGYRLASGDAAIELDADLQDPPEMIPQFIARWLQGAEIVYGIRAKRPESWIMESLRKSFYRMMRALTSGELPLDAGDFCLLDRKVIEYLKTIRDARPYIRGLVFSVGFRQIGIPYERAARKEGKSNFNLLRLFSLALDGIFSHSMLPLRVASMTGLALTSILVVYFLVILGRKFFLAQSWPSGFATITGLILLSLSIIALFLGIIGEYVGRIYEQVRNRPPVVIDQAINTATPLTQFSRPPVGGGESLFNA